MLLVFSLCNTVASAQIYHSKIQDHENNKDLGSQKTLQVVFKILHICAQVMYIFMDFH